MKASAVVNALNIADSTVRKYADLYAEFLSPTGIGGAGRHRDYTEHDVRVLKLIRDMKYEHVSNEDIDATLRSLQVGGWDRLPALDGNTKAIIPAPGAAIAAQSNREAWYVRSRFGARWQKRPRLTVMSCLPSCTAQKPCWNCMKAAD